MNISAKVKALFTTYKSEFKDAMASFSGDYEKIATKVTSASASNTYGWLGQSSSFREWVGPRIAQNVSALGYTVLNKTFEMTVKIPRNDIDDDNLGMYTPLVQEMGQEAQRDIDKKVFGALPAGATALCYDGVSFFNAAHPRELNDDGTPAADTAHFSNVLVPAEGTPASAAWYVLTTKRAIKPVIYQERRAAEFVALTNLDTADVFYLDQFVFGASKRDAIGYSLPQFGIRCTVPLTEENFSIARLMLETMTGDKNKPLGLTADTVVVDPSNRSAGEKLFAAQYNAYGASNTFYKAAELIVTPYIVPGTV